VIPITYVCCNCMTYGNHYNLRHLLGLRMRLSDKYQVPEKPCESFRMVSTCSRYPAVINIVIMNATWAWTTYNSSF
jgi:hypothetical protein